MKPLRIEAAAERELEAILDYIAANGSPQNAVRFVERIRDVIESIPEMPRAGMIRDDLLAGMRQRTVGRYSIFYEETEEAIVILHIVHGMRHLPAIFGLESVHKIENGSEE
ncbi:MAG: type II toxin-antitoxin system RelE/ParE family toxin [Fimbriimonas sp.]